MIAVSSQQHITANDEPSVARTAATGQPSSFTGLAPLDGVLLARYRKGIECEPGPGGVHVHMILVPGEEQAGVLIKELAAVATLERRRVAHAWGAV